MLRIYTTYLFLCVSLAFSSAQNDFALQLNNAAIELTTQNIQYNPAYFSIAYPGGDIPAHFGVCTDVIIRAYRKLDIDLQKEVHEDMKAHFNLYPDNWGLSQTDTNIDHRRVPNLMVFFARKGHKRSISPQAKDYKVGDIVCWSLGGGITHIGIVIDQLSEDGKRPLIVHNIGGGQVIEDCLFTYKIIGHYTYPK